MNTHKKLLGVAAHFIGWLIFLSFPILLSPEPPQELQHKFGNLYLLPLFFNSIVLIILFYFNYFVLIPKYLFTNRYIIYILFSLFCITITLFVSSMIAVSFYHKPPHAMFMNPPAKRLLPMAFNNAILMFAITFLASIVLRLNNRWKLTEQERLRSELSSLKSQINPHFLFNTLNNIYAETLGKANNAAEMILKLSNMMRYTITEVHNDKVSLQKEFDYISDYIELQKLRLPPKISLKYMTIGEAHELEIAPLLLIPFVENAFKHGVNPELHSEIKVRLEIIKSELHLSVFNKKVELEKTIQETTGLGVENTRLRLNLIYPEKHLLIIEETDDDYSVSLYINLA
jgi:sensor histidine kinase YesM